jgi:hypothetical protein
MRHFFCGSRAAALIWIKPLRPLERFPGAGAVM